VQQVGQDQGPRSPLADLARVDRSDREASRHGNRCHARTGGVTAKGRLHQPGAADAEHRSRGCPLEEPDDVEEGLAVGCEDEQRCGGCADRSRQDDPAASELVGGATRYRQREHQAEGVDAEDRGQGRICHRESLAVDQEQGVGTLVPVATASSSSASRRSALQVTRRSLAPRPGTTADDFVGAPEETLRGAVRVPQPVIASTAHAEGRGPLGDESSAAR
jgi:hypothetical protein